MSAVTACHSMRLVAESSRVRPSLSPVNWWPDFTAGAAAFIEVRDLGTVSTGISSPGVRSGTKGLSVQGYRHQGPWTEDPDDDDGLSIC